MSFSLKNGGATHGYNTKQHTIRGALIYMMNQLEPGHCCPYFSKAYCDICLNSLFQKHMNIDFKSRIIRQVMHIFAAQPQTDCVDGGKGAGAEGGFDIFESISII
jgi:hypothetical protein